MDSWEQIAKLRREGLDAVVITITGVRGSVPGQLGAKAVVTAEGIVVGNLGGGKVEAKAAALAAVLLGGDEACVSVTWNLQQDVGMTCGGEMAFLFERLVAQEPWHIAIFGAGHVAQALVPVLATLACRIDVIDPRAEWLEKFSAASNVQLHQLSNFEAGIAFVTARSYVISVTQGHASDRPVLRDVLRQFPSLPFLGVIGSAAKRAVLKRELLDDGLAADLIAKMICPVGLPIGGNDPAEIAISVAAQLLAVRRAPVGDHCSPIIG